MAQNVVINGVQYSNVPEVDIPLQGGGTARFLDTSDATISSGSQSLEGVTSYGNGIKYTGTIPSKAAATITPTTSDQTISAGQYLTGAQTIKGDANLIPQNILSGISIFNVDGTLTLPVISQDSTTKVLSIA